MDEAHPGTEGNLLYSESADKTVIHIQKIPLQQCLVLDQTSGHHLLARLTHKISHHSLQLLACKVGSDTFLFAFADSNNVYRRLGPKSVKRFVPQTLLLLQ